MATTKKRTLAEIVAAAKPIRKTVRLCTDGDLLAEHERLEAQLEQAHNAQVMGGKLNSAGEVRRLAEAVQKCEKAIRAAEDEYEFEKLSGTKWSTLKDEHGPREGKERVERWNPETFPKAAVAASCVSPEGMDDAAVFSAFWDGLNEAQRDVLFRGAYAANEDGASVPFSATASLVLSTSRPSSTT